MKSDAGASPPRISLPRLYALRAGYLLLAGGLAVTIWPEVIHHDTSWPLMQGVVNCMLAALSALAFLGLRYPLQMLPLLLFESAWKLIWLAVVAFPLWSADRMDADTLETTYACLGVVIILIVIPWRYVYAHYVAQRGDRWRQRAQPTPVTREETPVAL
jgi:hypothetical protein